jgi:hypothetical protein
MGISTHNMFHSSYKRIEPNIIEFLFSKDVVITDTQSSAA